MTNAEVKKALKKADIIEKELVSTPEVEEVEKINEEVEKQDDEGKDTPTPTPQTKHRSVSGTSFTSDLSSADEEVAGYFEKDGKPMRYKRTLRLPSDKLKALRLEYGSNDARFSITTKFQVAIEAKFILFG